MGLRGFTSSVGAQLNVEQTFTAKQTFSSGIDMLNSDIILGTGKIKRGAFGATLPSLTADDEFLLKDKAQTPTNKIIDLANNTLSGTKAQFDTALSDDNFAFLGNEQTFSQKQIISVASTALEIIATNSGVEALIIRGNAFPKLVTKSTANSGQIGEISFFGQDSLGNDHRYALIAPYVAVNTDGAEDGQLRLYISKSGTAQERLRIHADYVYVPSVDFDIDSAKKLFYDGGSDTYDSETSANTVKRYAGGVEYLDSDTARIVIGKGVSQKLALIQVKNAVPSSGYFTAEQIGFYLDEATNELKVKAMYSDGVTVKSGVVATLA